MKEAKDKNETINIRELERKVNFYNKIYKYIPFISLTFIVCASFGVTELLPFGEPMSLERNMNTLAFIGMLITSTALTGVPTYIFGEKILRNEQKLKKLKLQEKTNQLTEPEKQLVKEISKDKKVMGYIKELNVSQIPQEKINLIKETYQNSNIVDFITEVQTSNSYDLLQNYDIDNNVFIEEKSKTKKKSIF